jgi:integrase
MGKFHLYQRKDESRNWQALAYLHGRRYRFSCRTTDKATARQYAHQQVNELQERHNRGLIGLPQPLRMSEVFDRYEREYAPKLRPSAQKRMMDVVRQARRWFTQGPLHDPPVQHVTAREIQALLEAKRSEGVTARTVNLYRANLHRVFQLCVRPWLLIPANPAAGTEALRHDPREPVLLSEGEYDALRAACAHNPMLGLFVTLAWETAARSGEVLQLEWRDVDFDGARLTFANDAKRGRQTKGRRSRTVPLSARAVAALRHHAARFRLLTPRSPYVFKHLREHLRAQPGDRLDGVLHQFKRAAQRAGLPDVTPHGLRHSFITRKLAEGVPVQLVQHYVGHRTITMTMRYTHLVPEHLRAVVEEPAARVVSGH